MRGKHERLVKARRIAAFAFLAGLAVAAVATVVTLAMPNASQDVQGIAAEATRDVNGMPSAPVTYSFNGIERTELVPRVKVVAGEQVTFGITENGMPASGSWVDVVFFAALTLAVMTLVTFGFAITTVGGYENNLRRARGRDWAGSRNGGYQSTMANSNRRWGDAYTYLD